MIIKLDSYNDLGKCSFGTLLPEFDTDKEKIYIVENGYKMQIKIESVEDLLPFLWANSGASCNNEHYFASIKPWWYYEYHGLITKGTEECKKLLKKIQKPDVSVKLLTKYKSQLEMWNPKQWIECVKHYDERRKNVENRLIAENK